jgi:hypothetical protein
MIDIGIRFEKDIFEKSLDKVCAKISFPNSRLTTALGYLQARGPDEA